MEYHDPPHTRRMQKFVAGLWSTCAASNRARVRGGVELRAAVAEAQGLRRRYLTLVRDTRQQDEAARRRATAEEIDRRRTTDEEAARRRATTAEAARLRAAVAELEAEKARLRDAEARLRAAAEEEEVRAQDYRRLAVLFQFIVAAAAVMIGILMMALTSVI